MQTRTFLSTLLLAGFGAATACADSTLYSQPATDANTDGYYIWASVNSPSGNYQTFDNFSLNATSSINTVQWTGTYVDPTTDSNNPAQPNSTSFRIVFYLDNSGLPGSSVSTATVALADCHPTLLGMVNFTVYDGTSVSIPTYSYSAQLPSSLVVTGGQRYWISFVSNSPAGNELWGWYSGRGGDGQCVTNFGNVQTRQNDCSFALQGALSTKPSVPSTFFQGEASVGNGAYYLAFQNGNYFGYYSFLSDSRYIYHFDLGYEFCFDAGDGLNGVYLYDFASGDFFYTSPTFPFPYLYDFSLNTVLYYYPDPKNAGHYSTDGVRYFYDFATGKIISK